MTSSKESKPEPNTFNAAVRDAVTSLMFDMFADESSPLGDLDRWTERRIVAEIMAKTHLVLESDDPVECCYQNLIREIDFEAEMGVLLVNSVSGSENLQRMCEEPGVSGELHREMDRIAPTMFPDEYAHSDGDLDLVWVAVKAMYDRANIDAQVSELIIRHTLDSAEHARDMTNALRSMFHTFHEEGIRRQFDLSSLIDEREMHDLFIMISELMKRAGSYKDRIDAIGGRAGTA